jgi:hypothetical protein
MSKEQINYLLALATLLVVWLYFNTFVCTAKKNCGGGPWGGMPMRGMMYGPGGRSPNPMGMQNPAGMQNIQQPPNITELLKNQVRSSQIPAVSSKDKTAKS